MQGLALLGSAASEVGHSQARGELEGRSELAVPALAAGERFAIKEALRWGHSGGGGVMDGFKENLLVHSFVQGFPENVSGFKYQQPWRGCQGGVTSSCWENSCHRHGRYENQPGDALGPGTAHPNPEGTGQEATRSPPVGSWSSALSARWAQSHSDHAGVCPSLGLAT